MTHKQLAPYLVGELMEKEKDKTTGAVTVGIRPAVIAGRLASDDA